jgi:hypothetical protein
MLEHQRQSEINKKRREVPQLFLDKITLVSENINNYLSSLQNARGNTLRTMVKRTQISTERYVEIA